MDTPGDEKGREKKILEELMAENHPNLMKTLHIHKARQIQGR